MKAKRGSDTRSGGRWMPALAVLWLLLGGSSLFAQTQIRLLNGTSFISSTAVATNETKLAALRPTDDIRITFVTNYVSVKDRYTEYTGKTLMEFAAVPYGNITPLTQSEINDALNDAIDHALTTATGTTDNTIHIVYATLVSPTRQNGVEIHSRKYFDVGTRAKTRTKGIVEQVKPDPEADPQWGTPLGDDWLDDYVDEMTQAINDPNYVVNGSVAYDGEVYYSGDTLFYFHTADELITAANPVSRQVELLINRKYNVASTSWSEQAAVPGTSGMLNGGTNSRVAGLRLGADQFNGVTGLTAAYGNTGSMKTSLVYFVPVNLRLEVADTDVVEEWTPPPNQVTLTNNGNPFSNISGYSVKISAYQEQSSGALTRSFFDRVYTGNQTPSASINYPIDACGQVRYQGKLYRGGRNALVRHNADQRVKCGFTITNIQANAIDDSGNAIPSREITSEDADTLFVVVNPADDTHAELMLRVNYDGDRPGTYDYWGYQSTLASMQDDAEWSLQGNHPGAYLGNLSGAFHHDVTISPSFPSAFYPDYTFNFTNQDIPFEVNPMTFSAFDQQETVQVAFVRQKLDSFQSSYTVPFTLAEQQYLLVQAPWVAYATEILASLTPIVEALLVPIIPSSTDRRKVAKALEPAPVYKETFTAAPAADAHTFNIQKQTFGGIKTKIAIPMFSPPQWKWDTRWFDFAVGIKFTPFVEVSDVSTYHRDWNAPLSQYQKVGGGADNALGSEIFIGLEGGLKDTVTSYLTLEIESGLDSGFELRLQDRWSANATPVSSANVNLLEGNFVAKAKIKTTPRSQLNWTLLEFNEPISLWSARVLYTWRL